MARSLFEAVHGLQISFVVLHAQHTVHVTSHKQRVLPRFQIKKKEQKFIWKTLISSLFKLPLKKKKNKQTNKKQKREHLVL